MELYSGHTSCVHAKNSDRYCIAWSVTPLSLVVVLMTSALCLNKDLHTNGYEKYIYKTVYESI